MGAQFCPGINLWVINIEGEIISDRLKELHHASGSVGLPKGTIKGGEVHQWYLEPLALQALELSV